MARRILRNDPVARAWNTATAGGERSTTKAALDMFSPDDLDEIRASGELDAMIAAAKESEASTRAARLWLEALRDGGRRCTRCGKLVLGRADRVFCSEACRQAAHRARHS